MPGFLTWDTQAPVAGAHAATDPVGAGVEGTEVHQLSAGWAREACSTAAAEAQAGALRRARAVVVARAGRTGVHTLLTHAALIP